jgi:hypothetical protein
MSASAPSAVGSWRRVVLGAVITLTILGIFLAANAHLLYVALQSQPDCVTHEKAGEAVAGQFSAAKSSC